MFANPGADAAIQRGADIRHTINVGLFFRIASYGLLLNGAWIVDWFLGWFREA